MKKFYNLTQAVILAGIFFGSLLPVTGQTIQLGTGTSVNGTTTSSPVNIYYRRTVSQFVYTAAELNAAGISGPCVLQDLGWFVTQSPAYNIPGYTVKVKHVTANNVAGALGTGGWATVKNSFTYNPTAGGWDMLGLNNSFTWNGTDNIGVELCWSQVTPNYNSSGRCRIYSTGSGYRYTWTDAGGSSCGSTPNSVNTNKPQVQMVWGCVPPCVTPGPPTASATTVTCGTQANLVATGTPNGGTYNWYSDAAGTNLVGTGNVFATPVLYSSTMYYVAAFVPANCESTLVPVTVTVTSNVAAPTANNVNVSCGSSATVSVSGSTGNYTWFSDANGSNSMGSGSSVSLGNLTSDSTVYVAAISAGGSQSGSATYDIDLSNLLGLPNGNNNTRYNCSNAGQGFQWLDATPAGATITSVNLEFKIGVECAPGNKAASLNSAAQPNFTSGANHCSTATPGPGSFITMNLNPGDYSIGVNNVFSTSGHNSCFGLERTATLSNYFARVTVNYTIAGPGCQSALVPVIATVTSNVALPTANNVNVSCGSSATVSVSGSTGNYTWFSDANGNNSMGSGNSVSLGNLTSDSTVYVAASSGNGTPTTLYTQNWQAGQAGWTETNSSPYWNRISGQTGSSNTGPTGGSNNGTSTNGNFYMYLETSTGAGTSLLTGPGFTVSGQATFQFDYHMYGVAMGTLSVEAFNGTSWTQVWTLSGQQQTSLGAPWTTVSIPLTGYSGAINVRFVGIRGGSYTSDMAVDNIVLTETQPSCQSTLVAVTATVDPIPSPTVTGTAQICASNSTTLSATGSSLEWYSDVNGTNVVGTGNSFATPVLTTNTTYYVGEAQSGQTYDQTILINSGLSGNNAINFPGTPVGATGTPTLTIKAFGDIDGVGGNLEQWLVNDESGSAVGTAGGTGNFSDQCGTVITTVVNLSTANIDNWASNGSIDFAAVDPTGNINYTLCGGDYVQLQLTYSLGSPCSPSLTQVDITVTDLPIVNAGTDQTICLGNSAQLSGAGGTSTSYQWSQPSSLSSAVILNPLATPANTTVYTLTGTVNGCSSSDDVAVTLPTPSNNLSANNSSQTCVVKENNYIHFMGPNTGDLIASVNSGGQNLGNVTITSYENGLTQDVESCSYPGNLVFTTAVLGRHWVVTSEFQPTSSVEVLLPYHFSQFDATAYEATNNQNPDDNMNGQYDIGCTKYSGINENAIFTDNCNNGTFTWHNQNSTAAVNTILSAHTSTDYFVTVSVDGFSEFWLHGSQNLIPLPVELTSFQANCMSDNKIEVSWSTASEYNASHFIIERSINDGEDWEIVQEVDAIGFSQVESLYSIEDFKSSINRPMYYRLRQFDIDGSQNEEKVISIDCSGQQMILHPNPGNGKVTVQFYSPVKDDNSMILIEDLRGGRVLSIPANLKKGSNQIFFDVSELTTGMYMVKIVGAHFSSAMQKYIKH